MLEDEATSSLTDTAWRLFSSLILLADDYGNLRGSPAWISGQVFWASPKQVDVEHYLCELARKRLIVRYTVRDQAYLAIRSWDKHQRIDKPGRPKVPGPEESPQEIPANNSEESREEILGVSVGLATDLGPRIIGKEEDLGKEKDQHVPLADASSPPPGPGVALALVGDRLPDKPRAVPPHHADIAAAYAHWRQHHPRAPENIKTTSDGFKKAAARLGEKRTLADLIAAIDGMHATPWYAENNQTSFEMAMRPDKFLMFLENNTTPPRTLTEKDRAIQQAYRKAVAGEPGMFEGVI